MMLLMATKLSQHDKDKQNESIHYYLLMRWCFLAFLIGNATNFLDFIWISDSWIELRVLINYIARPIFWLFFWWKLLEKKDYDDLPIKKQWINWVLLSLVLILSFLSFIYVLKYEQKKIKCKDEKTLENYIICISESDHNRFNLFKIF